MMMSDDTVIADGNIENLTLRHLCDLRQDQQVLFSLIKRQAELLGRLSTDMDRNTAELKSDIVLPENCSLTAMEDDAYLRHKMDDLTENMTSVLTGLESVQKQIGSLTDAFGTPLFKKDQ